MLIMLGNIMAGNPYALAWHNINPNAHDHLVMWCVISDSLSLHSEMIEVGQHGLPVSI